MDGGGVQPAFKIKRYSTQNTGEVLNKHKQTSSVPTLTNSDREFLN